LKNGRRIEKEGRGRIRVQVPKIANCKSNYN